MDWNTDAKVSQFDVNAPVNTMTGNRSAQRTESGVGTHTERYGFLNLGKREVSNLDTVSVVGMNVNEVPNMRNAIEDYCTAIEEYVKGLNPTADASGAFQSEEVQSALTNYMEDVKMYCMNLVSQLKAFSDKLADVKNQWEAAAGEMASSISNTAGAGFATGTAYQQTIQ